MFRRARVVRDPNPVKEIDTDLASGKIYRITYAMGESEQRRVTRSVAMFDGRSERRDWHGEPVSCLDFLLPQGRALTLRAIQLIDLRPAEMNERGQWVLQQARGSRPRAHRRAAGAAE